jgi:hypothetical protein
VSWSSDYSSGFEIEGWQARGDSVGLGMSRCLLAVGCRSGVSLVCMHSSENIGVRGTLEKSLEVYWSRKV